MKEELELKLQEDFPFMQQNRVESEHNIYRKWGIECSNGWYQLLHDLCQEITDRYAVDEAPVDIVIQQIKEKFAKWLWRRWQKTKEDGDYTLFINKMREVHNLCCIVRADPYNSNGAKWELRAAEWELYDFFFWGNYFQNSIDTVSKWFDERRFAINYDLLKEGKRNYNENP